jgi:hypothetical protein
MARDLLKKYIDLLYRLDRLGSRPHGRGRGFHLEVGYAT